MIRYPTGLTIAAALILVLAPLFRARAEPPASPPTAKMDTADHSAGWIGRAAPAFTLNDAVGHRVNLGTVIGKAPVVLIFYRGVWCPFCQSQMADLAQHRSEFQRLHAPVYAISNEAAPALLEMQSRHRLDFVTFLSDPDGAAAKPYAGLYPNSTVHQPGVFVIDRHGRVVYAYLNSDYKTRAATTSLLAALRQAAK